MFPPGNGRKSLAFRLSIEYACGNIVLPSNFFILREKFESDIGVLYADYPRKCFSFLILNYQLPYLSLLLLFDPYNVNDSEMSWDVCIGRNAVRVCV